MGEEIVYERREKPTRCPYCARCLLEPDPFDYERWRYHKPEASFKRPEDIDVEAFVRAALARRGQVKVFDRLYHKKFNEPCQRKRAPQKCLAPVFMKDRSGEASVEPDQDCGKPSSTMELTATTVAGTLTATTGAG